MKASLSALIVISFSLLTACSSDGKNDEMSKAISRPIEKANNVEDVLMDSEAQRRKEMEAQGL